MARFGTGRRPKPARRPAEMILTRRGRTAVNRREALTSPAVRKSALTRSAVQIEKSDKEIKACVVQDEELLAEVRIMTVMPG